MPSMEAFISGAVRTITRAEVIAGGSPRRITRGEAYLNGAWRSIVSFIPPMTATVSPVSAYGSQATNATVSVSSNNVTATPSGGAAPYSYLWSLVSGSGIAISNPNQATTRFSAPIPPASSRSGVARVTITDSRGTVVTVDVSVTLENIDIR